MQFPFSSCFGPDLSCDPLGRFWPPGLHRTILSITSFSVTVLHQVADVSPSSPGSAVAASSCSSLRLRLSASFLLSGFEDCLPVCTVSFWVVPPPLMVLLLAKQLDAQTAHNSVSALESETPRKLDFWNKLLQLNVWHSASVWCWLLNLTFRWLWIFFSSSTQALCVGLNETVYKLICLISDCVSFLHFSREEYGSSQSHIFFFLLAKKGRLPHLSWLQRRRQNL